MNTVSGHLLPVSCRCCMRSSEEACKKSLSLLVLLFHLLPCNRHRKLEPNPAIFICHSNDCCPFLLSDKAVTDNIHDVIIRVSSIQSPGQVTSSGVISSMG